MRGIAKGEQSTLTNPILQLFCRSGGFLKDLVSGSFKIESIIGSAAPATVVASTDFVSGTHKVGTGRYAILTGSTSSWTIGTYRAVCTYKMVAGGPDLIQVIEFEVLDAADWPTGAMFQTYLTTRSALTDGYITTADTTQKVHRAMSRLSRMIERICGGRIFEPRYMHIRLAGQGTPILIMPEAIIAVEDIYTVWPTADGEQSLLYDQDLFKIYNRHLDNLGVVEDDRFNPRIELSGFDGTGLIVEDYQWPSGSQNMLIKGVFGYTDPEGDPTNSQALIGRTPDDIGMVLGSLLYRWITDPTMSDPTVQHPGSIASMKTRDQAISFGSGSSSSSADGSMTGDAILDSILAHYGAPWAVGGA